MDQHGRGGLLPIDVPVEGGCGVGVVGAAVSRDDVSGLVPGLGPTDDRGTIW